MFDSKKVAQGPLVACSLLFAIASAFSKRGVNTTRERSDACAFPLRRHQRDLRARSELEPEHYAFVCFVWTWYALRGA